MKSIEDSKRDLKKWLRTTVQLKGVSIDSAWAALSNSLEKEMFRIINADTTGDIIQIKALFGSRIIATLFGVIPFGRHFPSGKRLHLTATLSGRSDPTLKIEILPYMGLINEEEIGGVSQSMTERISDEFFVARKMHCILTGIHRHLDLLLPQDLLVLDKKILAKDSFLGVLIFPLDSYRKSQAIHIPTSSGANWCWGGFLLPEFWFLWHEIWGVSLLATVPTAAFFELQRWNIDPLIPSCLLVIIILIRITLGFYGSTIYFAKHGRWPNGHEDLHQ